MLAMNQKEVEAFIAALPHVEVTENFGYKFFFVGDERMLPFATIANTDSEYDNKSQLDRDGVYRLNIGVSKGTFHRAVGHIPVEGCDFTQLNTLLPHPDYAKQSFLCILCPDGDMLAQTLELLQEAHSIAQGRQQKREDVKRQRAT